MKLLLTTLFLTTSSIQPSISTAEILQSNSELDSIEFANINFESKNLGGVSVSSGGSAGEHSDSKTFKLGSTQDYALEIMEPLFTYDYIVANAKYVTANGTFRYETNKNPLTKPSMELNAKDENHDKKIVFNGYYQHRADNGWGHQQASINTELTLTKRDDGFADIVLVSEVRAASQGSVTTVTSATTPISISFKQEK
ncbi:hypothetical protein [Spiroplasma endosymbiont of Othius punctulatus]|uniref:hypothetical protein n=1 Tax=Spiroplasma endosymbiont of Othius punctulatus TaxID=3066289 RepID=UPI0030CEAABA